MRDEKADVQRDVAADAGITSRLISVAVGRARLHSALRVVTITADNFFSWPVAVWFATAILIVFVVWLATVRVRVVWQRVFIRAAMIALCLAPLPALEMFTEAVIAGHLAIVPLWYALFSSVVHGAILATVAALFVWLVLAYFLWVLGMSVHHLFNRSHAA